MSEITVKQCDRCGAQTTAPVAIKVMVGEIIAVELDDVCPRCVKVIDNLVERIAKAKKKKVASGDK